MSQGTLFAIQLVDEIDSPYQGHSKDAKALGIDAADAEYLLKRLQDGARLPLTEWFGHHLCRLVGVPTPEFAVVLRLNGEPAFGSKIDSSLVDFNRAGRLSHAERTAIVINAAASEAAALMLDAFFPNPDRHFGNWLYAARHGKFVALAIDWSRVVALAAMPFAGWPWPAACASASTADTLRTVGALPAADARRVAAELARVSEDDIAAIIGSAPELWRAGLDIPAILNWWRDGRAQRIDDSLSLLLP